MKKIEITPLSKLKPRKIGNNVKPTPMQRKAFDNIVKKGMNMGESIRDAGYSEAVTISPQKVTKTKGWQMLMDEFIPEEELAKKHKELLNSTRIDHMVFPTSINEDDIYELLESVNCTVKKIQFGEMAIHVWFWSANDKARKDGLDMAYKLRGSYAAEKVEVSVEDLMANQLLERRQKK